MLDMAGAKIEKDKWYSNLYTRGNTGSASILIMLDDFIATNKAKVGDTIICMVPAQCFLTDVRQNIRALECQ